MYQYVQNAPNLAKHLHMHLSLSAFLSIIEVDFKHMIKCFAE